MADSTHSAEEEIEGGICPKDASQGHNAAARGPECQHPAHTRHRGGSICPSAWCVHRLKPGEQDHSNPLEAQEDPIPVQASQDQNKKAALTALMHQCETVHQNQLLILKMCAC